MKNISRKVFLITGLIAACGSPVHVVALGIIFPSIPEKFFAPIFYFFLSIGVILLTFSLAKKRMERGVITSESLFKVLTPAQVCLIISMLFLFFGVVLGAFINQVFGGFLDVLGLIGILVSIVLAIRRAVTIRKAKKRSAAATNSRPYTPPVRTQYHSKDYCERCGASAEEGTYKKLNGHKYCDRCAEIMRADENSEILKAKTKCGLCGREFNKSEMVFVDDKYICDNCFSLRYNAGEEKKN